MTCVCGCDACLSARYVALEMGSFVMHEFLLANIAAALIGLVKVCQNYFGYHRDLIPWIFVTLWSFLLGSYNLWVAHTFCIIRINPNWNVKKCAMDSAIAVVHKHFKYATACICITGSSQLRECVSRCATQIAYFLANSFIRLCVRMQTFFQFTIADSDFE